MPYIPPEVVVRAREMDLLTYLRTYEPQELVHFGGNTYCTREHDSLKISNGKWCWFSRGIGGYSALDYLIKVKEIHSLKQGETHVLGEATILKRIGDNDYLAEYNGVKCHAIFNPFAGRYFVDDVYGVIRSSPDRDSR